MSSYSSAADLDSALKTKRRAPIWYICFVAVWSSELRSRGAIFYRKQGMGMTQQQGVRAEFLLAPLRAFGEAEGGVRIAVKNPTCL
ncbi:hypothetical protein NQZ68_033055 [Dissostichus eleginoides]|nr:hypothetical protein NQZ68_033055 [Dissostichus eleginoides]